MSLPLEFSEGADMCDTGELVPPDEHALTPAHAVASIASSNNPGARNLPAAAEINSFTNTAGPYLGASGHGGFTGSLAVVSSMNPVGAVVGKRAMTCLTVAVLQFPYVTLYVPVTMA